MIVGGHLDSWDLAQGATDNGTGSVVVLETARLLVKSGLKPRRTIRFVLFTGEEQGLHGSKAYVTQHKDELPRISACLVHDTGTGKVIGMGLRHRPILRPLLEKELASLHGLGLTNFQAAYITGSDHASFDRAGVPGLMFWQELAGYRLSHHTPADTVDRAIEANLIQSVQVMAVTALRLANRDALLPRDKEARQGPRGNPKEPARPQEGAAPAEPKPAKPQAAERKDPTLRRFGLGDLGRLVGLHDPQVSPDGKSVVVVVSRPNYDSNRTEAELVLVEVATGKQRVLTHDREGVGSTALVAVGRPTGLPGPCRLGQGSQIPGLRHADERRRLQADHQRSAGSAALLLESGRHDSRLCNPGRTREQEGDGQRQRCLRGRQRWLPDPGQPRGRLTSGWSPPKEVPLAA